MDPKIEAFKKQFADASDQRKAFIICASIIRLVIESKAPADIKMDVVVHALSIFRNESVVNAAVMLIQEFDEPAQIGVGLAEFSLIALENLRVKKRQIINLMELLKDSGWKGDQNAASSSKT